MSGEFPSNIAYQKNSYAYVMNIEKWRNSNLGYGNKVTLVLRAKRILSWTTVKI